MTSTETPEDWTTQPPYALETGKNSEDYNVRRGQCYCKRVQWGYNKANPLDAKFCHCTDCQRLHGAPFQWAAIFHKSSMLFTPSSLSSLIFYSTSTSSQSRILPCKVYCTHCRAPIMDEGRNMVLVFPTLTVGIAKDGEEGEEIRKGWQATCHIFYGSRMVDIVDGKNKWKGHKDGSELVDEKEKRI